jgi:hypothetical protein
MKSFLKISIYLLFTGAINVCLAQQKADSTKKQVTLDSNQTKGKQSSGTDNKISVADQAKPVEKGKKDNGKKKNSGVSNKIAVSDQAKPSTKGTKKTSGTSNK